MMKRAHVWNSAGLYGLFSLAAAALLVPAACAQDATVFAGAAVMPDGSIAEDVRLVIRDGRIESVQPGAEGPVEGDVDWSGAVVAPGMIDVLSYAGVSGHNSERYTTLDEGVRALDAFDPTSADLRASLEAGVTSVCIGPAQTSVLNGTMATVKTFTGDGIVVLRDDGPALLSMGESVLDANFGPTSRAGAIAILREGLERAEGDGLLAKISRGEQDVMLATPTGDDLVAVLPLLGEYGLDGPVVHRDDLIDLTREFERGQSVVVGPIGLRTKPEAIAGAGAAERRKLDVVIRAGIPNVEPDSLRLGALMATRYGLSPDAARRAVTGAAAKASGVPDRVGSLQAGLDADLVAWSADPLRADARVLEVWVSGVRVHAAGGDSGDGSAGMELFIGGAP